MIKVLVMSIYCNRFIKKIIYLSGTSVFLLFFIFCFHVYAGNPGPGTRIMTIMLDPGHGGETDPGAKSPDGKYEKDMTLKIAGMIAAEFGNRYNIILTRTEDTGLDIPERTALANHFKADLFISIHAGGGFVHKTKGVSLCYFADNSQEDVGGGEIQRSVENTQIPVSWEKIQKKHEQSSSDFADIVKKNLTLAIKDENIKIGGANYAVLEGADMPAILIEAGYLTNPADEKALSGKEYTTGFIKGLGLAIDEYFQNIGLQEKIKRAKP